jgi:hypothetical protein
VKNSIFLLFSFDVEEQDDEEEEDNDCNVSLSHKPELDRLDEKCFMSKMDKCG